MVYSAQLSTKDSIHGNQLSFPLGAMGTNPCARQTESLGVGPRPMAPPPFAGGGENTLARRLAGGRIVYLGVPLCNPPGMAPLILGVSLVIRCRFLPIFTSHIVDQFLPIVCCRLQSSILLKTRPTEESLHRTCRTFRGESDSSTLEVSGGLWVIVFEASR